MRLLRFKIIAAIVLICLGVVLLFIALFAYQLGLDPSTNMGPMRTKLAEFAVGLILLPFLVFLFGKIDQCLHIRSSITHLCERCKKAISARLPSEPGITLQQKRKKAIPAVIYCVVGVLIVISVSVWYITGGKMTQLTPYSHFYDMQADGFLAGKTSLLIEPPVELSQLVDPYDWKAREGFSYLWDASYYQGKYYIYWGPVPALLASTIKLIHGGIIEDQLLLLIFISGLVSVFSAFLYYLRKQYFASVPGWSLLLFTILFGFSTPIFWLINRPNVYETAIASCQFFLMLGVFAVVRGLNSAKHQRIWLLLTGLSLGLAVGSRISVVFTVFLVFGTASYHLITQIKADRKKIYSMLALLFPLVVCALGLAWFNFARFGSIFETGIHYQLTGGVMPSSDTVLYSPWYIAPNVILSLFQPYAFSPHEFPFINAISNTYWAGMVRIANSRYNVEPVSGIFTTIPFLWLLIIPTTRQLKRAWQWIKEEPASSQKTTAPSLPLWLWIILIGGTAVSFVVTILFVMMTMRYLCDFVPMLLLLAATLAMFDIERLKGQIWQRRLLLAALIILSLVSVIIGLLINFNNSDLRFQNINPALFEQISQWLQ
jgi:4-amino-4-deoxy-L-arabinose transferase-like glycosyltransferase